MLKMTAAQWAFFTKPTLDVAPPAIRWRGLAPLFAQEKDLTAICICRDRCSRRAAWQSSSGLETWQFQAADTIRKAPVTPARAHEERLGNQPFTLPQWPPSKYLAGVGRMRLTTLPTGKAMTLQEMQARSALRPRACRSFVSDLGKANLMVITVAAMPAVDAESAVFEPPVALGYQTGMKK